MNGFKVLTPDFRPPIQKGHEPLFTEDSKFPITLPTVELDKSEKECSFGWNFCKDARTAFQISNLTSFKGLNKLFHVTGSEDTIERGNKLRCSQLTLNRPVTEKEIYLSLKEPNNKQEQLYCWFSNPELEENISIITECLQETLKLKSMAGWKVVNNYNYNNYDNYNNYNYYNNNYDYNCYYYNNYNHNYYNYYNYYYIAESLFSEKEFQDLMLKAYSHQLRQIRFNTEKKELLFITLNQLSA